jgi:hypothetical protein
MSSDDSRDMSQLKKRTLNRRNVLLGGTTLAAMSAIGTSPHNTVARAQEMLPRPEPPFKGTIGRTYKDSVPDKIPLIKAADGAPNVLLILIDDCGFGQWGTFGGQIPTPNLDRLAKVGLRYTRFHTTALCSPTRAALLTGRNHHSAGTGTITELGDAYPGYSGQIPTSAAMVSEVLRRIRHRVVWQEPQRSRLGNQYIRSVRPLADPPRLRSFLWVHWWRGEPMGSGALSRQFAD